MKLHGVLVDFHRAGSRRYATTGKKCIPNFCEKKYCFQHSCNNSAMLPKDWGLMIEERCKKRFDHHLYITYMQSYNSKFGINTMLMTQCTESKLAPPGKKTHSYIFAKSAAWCFSEIQDRLRTPSHHEKWKSVHLIFYEQGTVEVLIFSLIYLPHKLRQEY